MGNAGRDVASLFLSFIRLQQIYHKLSVVNLKATRGR